MARVQVLGSINIDLVARASRLPRAGETVPGTSFATIPGGKGANQAVAASRVGADTYLYGAVGSDSFGKELRVFLDGRGVDVSAVRVLGDTTGSALIGVDDAGENFIIVVPGANGLVSPDDAGKIEFEQGDVLLMQDEVPELANIEAARRAKAAGCASILNLAPFRRPSADLLDSVDYLIVNETEYADLLDIGASSLTPAEVAGHLADGTSPTSVLIVTVGASGCYVRADDRVTHVPSYAVNAVDTTGAGDCFTGAFGASIARGEAALDAARYANAAAALSVTRPGAGPAMPDDVDVRALMNE